MARPSSVARESDTLVSAWRQNGQYTAESSHTAPSPGARLIALLPSALWHLTQHNLLSKQEVATTRYWELYAHSPAPSNITRGVLRETPQRSLTETGAGSDWLREAIPGAATMKASTVSTVNATTLMRCTRWGAGRRTEQATPLPPRGTTSLRDDLAEPRAEERAQGPAGFPLLQMTTAGSATSVLMIPPHVCCPRRPPSAAHRTDVRSDYRAQRIFQTCYRLCCAVRILTEVDTAPLTFSGQHMLARTNVRILG